MQEILEIPSKSKVAIYGAGEAGIIVNNFIRENRPDLNVVAFFDESVSGEIFGVKVFHIKEVKDKSFDFIIPASFSNVDILRKILLSSGVDNIINLSQIPRVDSAALDIPDSRFEKVLKILSSQRSKNIFKFAVDCYLHSSKCHLLYDYLGKLVQDGFVSKGQYYDFINFNEVKTMISGGALDGATTISFLNSFPNLQKIYAFEPCYEKEKKVENDIFMRNSGKVEIVEKGLYKESTSVNMMINGAASKITSYASSAIAEKIETVSIDDFVSENNIKKIDYIKMDIEGAELDALKGAKKTLISHRPNLAICIYHSFEDLFDIPLYLAENLKDYKFEIYHYSPFFDNNETVLYGMPQ